MKILTLFSLLLSLNSFAAEGDFGSITECGEYLVSGVVRVLDKDLKLVVNEKTKSEHILSIDIKDQGHIIAFRDKPVLVQVLLDKKFDGTKGAISEITQEARLRVPDPLKPYDTGFKLIKKSECRK